MAFLRWTRIESHGVLETGYKAHEITMDDDWVQFGRFLLKTFGTLFLLTGTWIRRLACHYEVLILLFHLVYTFSATLRGLS